MKHLIEKHAEVLTLNDANMPAAIHVDLDLDPETKTLTVIQAAAKPLVIPLAALLGKVNGTAPAPAAVHPATTSASGTTAPAAAKPAPAAKPQPKPVAAANRCPAKDPFKKRGQCIFAKGHDKGPKKTRHSYEAIAK